MKNNIRINVIVNVIRTLVLTLLSFITFPWVCRYLGDSAVGTYSWVSTFVLYFLILAKNGIPNLAVRECVKVRDDNEKLSNKVQGFFLLQCVTTALSFGLMCIVVFTVPAIRDSSALVFILSLNFLSSAFAFEWVFIALEKQFYMSVRSIVALTISAIITIAFVTTPNDIYIYALSSVSVAIITALANFIYIRKFISFKKTMPYDFKQYIKPLSVLFALTLLISLYNQTDTFILGFINIDKSEVASYSVGIKGVDIIIGIITALSTVFIPRAAFYYGKEDKRFFNNLTKYSTNICLFVVLPAIVTMCVLAKPICSLISGTYDYSNTNAGYLTAPTVLITLSAMMLTYSLGDIIYSQILLPMKKEKYYLYAMGGGTIINMILSIVLGGILPAKVAWLSPSVGVAIGTVCTDLLMLIFLFGVTWEWIKKAIFNKNTLKLLLANVVILAISLLLYNPLNKLWGVLNLSLAMTYIMQLIVIVLIDGIVYLVILGAIKEDLVYSFIRKDKVREEE